MSELPHPSVSTATIPAGMSQEFFNVSIVWKGKRLERMLGPDDRMAPASKERIESPIMRAFTAAYLVLKYGNRCFHRTEYCFMGDQPFEHPERANFDHIDGNNHNHALGNLRLSCQSCNSHLQWKQKLAPSSGGLERKIGSDVPEVVRINMENRPLYKKLLGEYIDLHQEISVYDAKFRLARKLQEMTESGSPQACENYLKTLTAGDDAPFVAFEGKVRKR